MLALVYCAHVKSHGIFRCRVVPKSCIPERSYLIIFGLLSSTTFLRLRPFLTLTVHYAKFPQTTICVIDHRKSISVMFVPRHGNNEHTQNQVHYDGWIQFPITQFAHNVLCVAQHNCWPFPISRNMREEFQLTKRSICI